MSVSNNSIASSSTKIAYFFGNSPYFYMDYSTFLATKKYDYTGNEFLTKSLAVKDARSKGFTHGTGPGSYWGSKVKAFS